MTKLNYSISRRTFVKSGVQLLTAIVGFKIVRATAAAANTQAYSQVSVQTSGYGTGAYGQATYFGYQTPAMTLSPDTGGVSSRIYLPLVTK